PLLVHLAELGDPLDEPHRGRAAAGLHEDGLGERDGALEPRPPELLLRALEAALGHLEELLRLRELRRDARVVGRQRLDHLQRRDDALPALRLALAGVDLTLVVRALLPALLPPTLAGGVGPRAARVGLRLLGERE